MLIEMITGSSTKVVITNERLPLQNAISFRWSTPLDTFKLSVIVSLLHPIPLLSLEPLIKLSELLHSQFVENDRLAPLLSDGIFPFG